VVEGFGGDSIGASRRSSGAFTPLALFLANRRTRIVTDLLAIACMPQSAAHA
jgi:hypothetical protein